MTALTDERPTQPMSTEELHQELVALIEQHLEFLARLREWLEARRREGGS